MPEQSSCSGIIDPQVSSVNLTHVISGTGTSTSQSSCNTCGNCSSSKVVGTAHTINSSGIVQAQTSTVNMSSVNLSNTNVTSQPLPAPVAPVQPVAPIQPIAQQMVVNQAPQVNQAQPRADPVQPIQEQGPR